jgi:spiro-SPASM protein
MKLDLYERLLADIAPYRDDIVIDIGLYGEPLLHPDIASMIRLAKDGLCRWVILNTNGLLLNEDTCRAICEAGLDFIVIGLDGVSDKTHQTVRGSGDYNAVVGNIERLLEVRARLSSNLPKVVLQIVKTKPSEEEIESYFDLWEKKVDHIVLRGFNRFNGRIEDISVIDCTPLERYPCRKMLDKISVLWNGDVPYCEQDYDGEMLLGNIAREPLSSIWERTQTIRLKHLVDGDMAKLPDMCHKCSEWYYV